MGLIDFYLQWKQPVNVHTHAWSYSGLYIHVQLYSCQPVSEYGEFPHWHRTAGVWIYESHQHQKQYLLKVKYIQNTNRKEWLSILTISKVNKSLYAALKWEWNLEVEFSPLVHLSTRKSTITSATHLQHIMYLVIYHRGQFARTNTVYYNVAHHLFM